MNVKNNIKKVTAVLASTALVATTMVGAMAYDLSDYPAPFVEDGMAQGKIVVGANAATQDVIGAIDIAASLQESAATPVANDGGVVTVEGGEDFDEIVIGNESTVFDTKMDDRKLEGFVDSDFDFDGSDIDYEEYINIGEGALRIQNMQKVEEYGQDLYMEAVKDGIMYTVQIDTDLGTLDYDEDDAEFSFLGRDLIVTDYSNDEMTVESASEYFMEEGDSVEVDGRDVTLVRVGQNAVLVEVDGQTLSIGNDDDERFDQAGNFEVEVKSSFYIEGADDNSATLKLGDSISQTVADGESAELFGEPSDDNEATWVWDLSNASDHTNVSLKLNQAFDDVDARDERDRDAIALGESIGLPNNHAEIQFASVSGNTFEELIVEVDNDYDLREDGTGDVADDADGYRLRTASDEAIFTVGNQDTSEVWVLADSSNDNFSIWYEDGTDEVNSTATTFTMKIDSDSFDFTPSFNMSNDSLAFLDVDFPTSSNANYNAEKLTFNATIGNDYFGDSDEEDSHDLTYDGTEIGSKEYDGGYFVTYYGAYFEEPEGQFDSGNSFSMMVPSELREATIVVRSEGSVVSSAGGSDAYSINPVPLGLGILDTDAPALGTTPMIIVGGPAANTVAAEFMGNPTSEEIAATFTEGNAMIRYNDDNMAMLVAGWGAMETLGASQVVADYQSNEDDFVGTELEVTVTDLSNVQVSSVE